MKRTGYKINIQKPIVVLYIAVKNEIKKAVSFTIASKRIIYLGINLTKEVWDLYPQNYNIFLKEIKDWSKQEDIQCSWIGSLNIIQVAVLLKLMYRFNKSVSKSQLAFFFFLQKLDQLILKFTWKCQGLLVGVQNQPLRKTVWQFLTKLSIVLPYDPATMFPGIYSEELKIYTHMETFHVFIWFISCTVYISFIHNCQNL